MQFSLQAAARAAAAAAAVAVYLGRWIYCYTPPCSLRALSYMPASAADDILHGVYERQKTGSRVELA